MRCLWCHRESADLETVVLPGTDAEQAAVHPEHRDDLLAFARRVRAWGTFFLVLLLVGTPILGALLVLLVTWVGEEAALWGAAGLLVWIGSVVFAFPFATPQTVRLLGVRRSIRLARLIGWMLFAGAVVLVLVG